MERRRLIRIAKARIDFYETLLNNHGEEMYPEDVNRYLDLMSKAYKQLRDLETEDGEQQN